MNSARERLRENNPFYSSSHPDPWVRQFPNITTLNGEVFSTIMRIIRNQKNKPTNPVGILIKGEAGMGKTHMIARIRECCEDNSFDIKFATIKPIIDHQTPLRRVLKGIITNLAHPVSDHCPCTQIHGMIFAIVYDYLTHQHKKKELVKNIDQDMNRFFTVLYRNPKKIEPFFKDVQTWAISQIPQINFNFIRLLFAFCNPKYQQIAYMRIKGEIGDPKEAELLQIPYRENPSDLEMEEEARDFLISLGYLLTQYNQNLIVCFDQLENLQTKELVQAFGRIIFTIINDCPSIIPLTFMRTLFWEDVFYPDLDQSVSERLAMNQLDLKGCSDSEIEEIIRTRIQEILPDQWNEPYTWLISEVRKTINKNPSPREVIRSANAIILQSDSTAPLQPQPLPADILQSAYVNERELILSDLDSWPPDYEELTKAVITYLSSQEYQIKQERDARKTILQARKNNFQCCIIINTNRNHSTIGSGFGKGTKYLQDNPGASCIYLTDPRCIITKKTWKAANQKKEEFLNAIGIIIQPPEGEIAWYYALYSIACRICEKDLMVETDSGLKPVTLEELTSHIKNSAVFHQLINQTTDNLIKQKKKKQYKDEHIYQSIIQILTKKSMHIIRTQTLTQELIDQGISITHDDLIIWCGKHSDVFPIIQSQQGSMVILQGSAQVCLH